MWLLLKLIYAVQVQPFSITVIKTSTIVYIRKYLRVHCYIDNMAKHFDYLVCKQWHKDLSFWWHWHVHWHKYLLLRDKLRILRKKGLRKKTVIFGCRPYYLHGECTNAFIATVYIPPDTHTKKRMHYRNCMMPSFVTWHNNQTVFLL